MRYERTTFDDVRFNELIILLDNELYSYYGKLQNKYDKKNIIQNDSYVIICINNGRPIACGCIRDTENSNVIELKRMFTIREERGKGIAKNVVIELEKWALELGKTKIILETGIKQDYAINMYKNIGFEIIENYGEYKGNLNSICMAKTIK
jgi:GNAT superfamily N-acetyltransferase